MSSPETLSTIGNISLFIIFGILAGTIFAPLIAYFGLIFEKHDAFTKTNYFLRTTWILAGVFAISLLYLLLFYPSSEGENSNPALALAPLGMMIAALIASASVMKNIAETKKNEADKHAKEASKFHLDKCTEGLEHFYELLKDGNNNRVKWIAAARVLLTTLDLSKGIKERHHMDFFELEKSKYRQKLDELYTKKEITSLFFTGIKDWDRSDITVSTIIESARNGDGYSYTYDDISNFIDENSIVAVFSILDYPDDYMDHDPLSNYPDRYKKALDLSWTFFEPKKSAYQFINLTLGINQYKNPL